MRKRIAAVLMAAALAVSPLCGSMAGAAALVSDVSAAGVGYRTAETGQNAGNDRNSDVGTGTLRRSAKNAGKTKENSIGDTGNQGKITGNPGENTKNLSGGNLRGDTDIFDGYMNNLSGDTGNLGGDTDNPGGEHLGRDTNDPDGGTDNPGEDIGNPGGDTDNSGGGNPGGNTGNFSGGTDNSGEDMDNSGGDTGNPGEDTGNPGGDVENPGENTENPGGDMDNPGGGTEMPGMDDPDADVPDMETPGMDTDAPESDIEMPDPDITIVEDESGLPDSSETEDPDTGESAGEEAADGEFSEEESDEEMLDFSDGDASLMAMAAGKSQIKVSRVTDTTNMNPDHAFCYGFRSGSTRLVNEKGGSASLLSKLKKQFQGAETGVAQSGYACSVKGNSSPGAYVMRYTNVGDYQGKRLDLRITVMGWGKRSNDHVGKDGTKITPSVVFSDSEISINLVAVLNVRFKFEFLQNGTNTVLGNIKCHMTMQDIDAGQKVYFYDSVNPPEHIYLGTYPKGSAGYNYLTRKYTSDSTGLVSSIQSGSGGTGTNDPWGWAQVDYTGALYFNYYYTNYGALEAKDARSCVFRATPKILGRYALENPGKKVGADGSRYDQMTAHGKPDDSAGAADRPYDIQAGGAFTYAVQQRLLPGTYTKFEVTDTLDSCLIYRSAQVTTASGYDVTGNFSVTASGNTVKFAAKPAFLNRAESFNDVTYQFFIRVTAKDNKTITAHGHYGKGDYYHIKNKASRTINNDTKTTNDSYVRGTASGTYYVKKVDSENPSRVLEGASFAIYEWNGSSYSATGASMSYDKKNGRYQTGILKRTARNGGRYRIVETKPPHNYEGVWTKEFNVSDTPSGTVFTAENVRIIPPLGTVTVTKNIREDQITWAHGNPVFRFCLTGTDVKGKVHTYEDYVEFQPGSYRVENGYAVLEHVFSEVPIGTYTLSEQRTMRYRFQSLIAGTPNVKVLGEQAEITLTEASPNAAAAFTNDKFTYSYYSHTDVIKNTIPIIWQKK